MSTRDSVSADLIEWENRCERIDDRGALANAADTANDDAWLTPSPSDQDRLIALSKTMQEYNADVLACAAVWAQRCVRK